MSEVVTAEKAVELEELGTIIQSYENKLSQLDERLQQLQAQNDEDENLTEVKKYHQAVSNDIIQIDDALDRVIHLETQLKILRRRNHVMEKEKKKYDNRLRVAGNALQKCSDELNMVIDITGWHEKYQLDREGLLQYKQDLQEMTKQEAKTRSEIRSMATLCRKKEGTIIKLQEQIDEMRKQQDLLNYWNNKIRVQQRENAEKRAAVDILHREDEKVSQILVDQEERDKSKNGSVIILEKDKGYLTEMRQKLTGTLTRQKRLLRAQEVRESQLRRRVDVLMSCLRDLHLEKAFQEKATENENGALVAAKPEPQQLSDIIPEEEMIPIDTYHLVYCADKQLESKNSSRSMLLLEREGVVQTMESQLAAAIERHNVNVEDLGINRLEQEQNTRQLIDDIQNCHLSFRKKVEILTRENTFLRNELAMKRQREKTR